MTNELKKQLKLYLSNNYKEGFKPLENQIPFELVKEGISDLQTELSNKYTKGFTHDGILTSNSEVIVAYGNYWIDDDDLPKRGYVALIDKNGNTIQIIDKYDSGTEIGYIHSLKVNENNEFYGVIDGNDYETPYLTLLNNFSIKKSTDTEYSVTRKINYKLTLSDVSKEKSIESLSKIEGQSYYGIMTSTSFELYKIEEVGTDNIEVSFYISGDDFNNSYPELIYNSDETITLNVYKYGYKTGVLTKYSANYSSSSSSSIKLISKYTYQLTSNVYVGGRNSVSIKDNYVYVIYNEIFNTTQLRTRLSKLNKEDLTSLVTLETLTQSLSETKKQRLSIQKGKSCYVVGKAIPNANSKYDNYIGILNEEEKYGNFITYTLQSKDTGQASSSADLIDEKYNLVKAIKYVDENGAFNLNNIWQTIYNPDNYNGQVMYDSPDMFKPQYANLYENDVVIFSRNLYNVTINENTTTSTLEVPNLYLNENTINKENLIGQTAMKMCEDTASLTKNIYETLYINFINTIRMKNITNFNEEISRDEEAMVLNQEMTWGLTNTSIVNKYRLVNRYSEEIKEFAKSEIEQIDDLTARYTISLFTAEEPLRIELINNNENFVYATIDCSRMEQGKFYKVTQDLVIN